MSQLLAPTKTLVDHIPLWLRIREIMKEKGRSYSLNVMSVRLGISRETLRLMLSGEREIYSFELEKIAHDLKIPLPRLLQEDWQDRLSNNYFVDLVAKEQWEEAWRFVKERHAGSIGLSERAETISKKAYVHFWKGDLAETKKLTYEMYAIAKEIQEKFKHEYILYKALRNLLNIYTHLNELDKAYEIIKIAEPIFQRDPIEMGLVYYTLSKMKRSSFDHAEAKMYLYKCLEQFLLTTDRDKIGRGYINCAIAEYEDLQFSKAKELLERAIAETDIEVVRLLAGQELAKTLIKLKELPEATSMIRYWLQTEVIAQHPEVKARLHILLSRATGDTRYAEGVATNLQYGIKIRFHAYRYLSLVFKRRHFQHRTGLLVKAKGRLPKRRLPLDTYF